MNYFPKNLKTLRKRKKLTQEELALISDIDRTILSKWESGKCEPDIKAIIKIASFFDVPVDLLNKVLS